MPKKPVVQPQTSSPWHVRALGAASSHPKVSVTALIAAVVAVVIALAQMRPALEWLSDHWETPAGVKLQVEEARRQLELSDAQIKREADLHAKADERRAGWTSYGIADLKVTVLKNRLRDCQEKVRTKATTENCEDYATEYKEAYDRAQLVYKAAAEASK